MSEHQSKQRGKLDANELSILCEQISLILRSGLPLHDGIEALCANYRDTRYAQRFEALNQAVLESGSLYEGIAAAGIFPKYMTEMTQIGERTGELDKVMSELSLYYERESKIKHAIQSAITYPIILIAMMAVLITVLIVRVLPIFEDVFRNMGISMDSASGTWISVGVNVGKIVLILSGVLIVLVLLFIVVLQSSKGSAAKSFIFRIFSPLQRMNSKLSASRFASAMSMMLKSGFPLDESLELISGIINDEEIARKVDECRANMQTGMTFPDAVEKLGLFEPLHCRMIRVGFQAGQIDSVMAKLASIYEDEVDDAISRAVSIIEPSLVALMSIIIGAILLAVMLPLLSLMSGMA